MNPQLQNPSFRFILLRGRTKIPREKGWQSTANYSWNDKTILTYDGNVGIVCGYGRLRILDCDSKEFAQEMLDKLPKTFTIKTPSGGLHFYFLSDYDQNHVLTDGKGEFRSKNYQCLIPGSKHPSGRTYEVIVDAPIAQVSKEELERLLQPYLRTTTPTAQRDDTRSGDEIREVMRLVRTGKTDKEINEVMSKYPKWKDAHQQYRKRTIKTAKGYIGNNDSGASKITKLKNQLHEELFKAKLKGENWICLHKGITFIKIIDPLNPERDRYFSQYTEKGKKENPYLKWDCVLYWSQEDNAPQEPENKELRIPRSGAVKLLEEMECSQVSKDPLFVIAFRGGSSTDFTMKILESNEFHEFVQQAKNNNYETILSIILPGDTT